MFCYYSITNSYVKIVHERLAFDVSAVCHTSLSHIFTHSEKKAKFFEVTDYHTCAQQIQ